MAIAGVDEQPTIGPAAPASRPIGAWTWAGIGAASAVAGLLPWIITGMRLPLQNLWATGTLRGDMPIGLLPFSQYSITLVAAMIVVGAAAAGLVARSTRARLGRRGFAATVTGALGVQVIAIVQTAAAVGAGLRPGGESMIYLVAVVAVATASFVVGALVLALIGRMPQPGALVGMSIAAVGAGWWADALVVPNPVFVSEWQLTLLGLLQWLPAVLCGVAIAWCGIHSIGRVIAAVIAVAAVVIGPAFATAVTSAAGTRVLARYPSEMIEYGAQVFQQALWNADLSLRRIVTAIIVAAAGLAFTAVIRRRPLAIDQA